MKLVTQRVDYRAGQQRQAQHVEPEQGDEDEPKGRSEPGETGDVGEVDREQPVGEPGGKGDENGSRPDRAPGHVPLRHRPEDHRADPESDEQGRAQQQDRVDRLDVGEPKGQAVSAGEQRALDRRHEDAGGDEEEDDAEHREREALLLDPAAALDVVDPAEGGIHRTPEGGADPERADEGGDPDRRRVVLDPVEDVGQRLLLDAGEEALEVADDAGLDPLDLQYLAEDEEHEQGKGEDRQHQVVGDHRREPGDVLGVGALPEGLEPETGFAQGIWH